MPNKMKMRHGANDVLRASPAVGENLNSKTRRDTNMFWGFEGLLSSRMRKFNPQ
jgi:hypothetical protein